MRHFLFLAAIVFALSAAPAAAQVQPLPPGTWVIPTDATAHPASSWPAATPFEMLEFTFYLEADEDEGYEEIPAPFTVEVASSPETDPDGTLADANRIDTYVTEPRVGLDEILSVRTRLDARWLATPGTYYWQAHEVVDEPDEGCAPCMFATPVRSLRITPAVPADPPVAPLATFTAAPAAAVYVRPPLGAATARIAIRRAILAATHRLPRGLTYRCAAAPGAATCRPTWRDTAYAYRGTVTVTAGRDGVSVAFRGERTRRGCRAERCARVSAWTKRL